MPRPGPRPYECVKRAWHSDRHKPIRGSLIQEIFRFGHFLVCLLLLLFIHVHIFLSLPFLIAIHLFLTVQEELDAVWSILSSFTFSAICYYHLLLPPFSYWVKWSNFHFGCRLANDMHSAATRKNKEWQEKLPIVVLKVEEIMYSKANSEVHIFGFSIIL